MLPYRQGNLSPCPSFQPPLSSPPHRCCERLQALTQSRFILLSGFGTKESPPPLQRPSTLQCCRTVPSKEAPNSTERQENCGHSCQLLSRWQYNTMLVIDQRLMGFRSADQETSASFVGEASSAIPHNRR